MYPIPVNGNNVQLSCAEWIYTYVRRETNRNNWIGKYEVYTNIEHRALVKWNYCICVWYCVVLLSCECVRWIDWIATWTIAIKNVLTKQYIKRLKREKKTVEQNIERNKTQKHTAKHNFSAYLYRRLIKCDAKSTKRSEKKAQHTHKQVTNLWSLTKRCLHSSNYLLHETDAPFIVKSH